MQVAIVGSGYVGLVAGACMAEMGHTVWSVDVDARKIADLQRNVLPIYEPGLESLVVRNQAAGRLRFTTDLPAAVAACPVIFIAVGTPPGEDGSADLQHVLAVARAIGKAMPATRIVATKSTVPVGTAAKVRAAIELETRHTVHVCSNPEFLKEGAAIDDFMKPDRIVLGVDSDEAKATLLELYEPFVRTGNPVIVMDVASAEVTKYAANAMLATRISFMNQMAAFCDLAGANIDHVRRGMGSDRRIGPAFLFPGPGYGGSCFPKDVAALIQTSRQMGLELDVLRAVEDVNEMQKVVPAAKLERALGGNLKDRRIAVWGLAFKAGTDDLRESPALSLIHILLAWGAKVTVHDPEGMPRAREIFGDQLTYATDHIEMCAGAEALVVMTEWPLYRNPPFARLLQTMEMPIVIDARNLYGPEQLRSMGFTYDSFGRPAARTIAPVRPAMEPASA